MDDFQALLEKKRNLVEVYDKLKRQPPQTIQTADKGATIADLTSMINKLVSLTMRERLNVEFCPDDKKEKIISKAEKLDHNVITYKVVTRRSKDEIKPRIRQEVAEKTLDKEDERLGFISGHAFKSVIQFNIFSKSYSEADNIMEEFELLMETYSGFFKRNGIKEIYFEEQLTDQHYDIYREILSVRNIQYYVETERLSVIFNEKVKEIEILMSEKEDK